jgi:hypothetical protein
MDEGHNREDDDDIVIRIALNSSLSMGLTAREHAHYSKGLDNPFDEDELLERILNWPDPDDLG